MTEQIEGGSEIEWTQRNIDVIDLGFWNDDGVWNDIGAWKDEPMWNEVSTGDRTD